MPSAWPISCISVRKPGPAEPDILVARGERADPDVAGLLGEAGIARIGREIVLGRVEIADVDVGGEVGSLDEVDVHQVAEEREGVAHRGALGLAQRHELALLGGIDLERVVEEGEGDRADPAFGVGLPPSPVQAMLALVS